MNTDKGQGEHNHMIIKNSQIESEKFQYSLSGIDTKQKHFKIKSSNVNKVKKIKVRYPTQFLMVGNIRCFFYSKFKQGRKPLLSIGPSWPFTIGLLVFAFLCLFYFLWMLTLLKILDLKLRLAAMTVMFTNLGALLTGIL